MKSLNARILCYWTIYCIVGCLLPEMVMSARYLPTRRSMPTQLERNERLRELFQHILESERDAHLSAANQFADQLKFIQKKRSDFGLLPDSIKDYNDEGDEYDDSYDTRKSHLYHQMQPWRFVLLNYGHPRRNQKNEQLNSNSKSHGGTSLDDLASLNGPRSQLLHKMYQEKQQKAATTNTNADAGEANSDLDWIASSSDLNSGTDYDALYDDVNEKSSSSSNAKFDRYRRNGPLAPEHKLHLT